MDQKALVEDLKGLFREVDSQYGPVALMMLLASDLEREDAWNLIVSTKEFDRTSRGDAIGKMTELLATVLQRKNWEKIIRVTVLKTDDPFVQEMNEIFETNESVLRLRAEYVSGVEIPKALVLQSKAAA